MSGTYILPLVLMIYDFLFTHLHIDFHFNECHSIRPFLSDHLSTISLYPPFLLFLIMIASTLKSSFPNLAQD